MEYTDKKNVKENSPAKTSFEFKEKRKWQIALRRYVLKLNKSSSYAPYFGIDVESFRKWIEIQFVGGLSWESFSSEWQFDHIVPLAHFNLADPKELKLCWNFTNIRVEKISTSKKLPGGDLVTAKGFFERLYKESGYSVCLKMIEFINKIPTEPIQPTEAQLSFLRGKTGYIEKISSFSVYDFENLNGGVEMAEILKEHNFLKKFE